MIFQGFVLSFKFGLKVIYLIKYLQYKLNSIFWHKWECSLMILFLFQGCIHGVLFITRARFTYPWEVWNWSCNAQTITSRWNILIHKIFFNLILNFVYKHFTSAFWLQNNLWEYPALDHKFKIWFCTQKLVLNVHFKDFWYTKINLTQIWQDEFN